MTISVIEIIITSISMSVDAMTVSATNGLEETGIKQGKMLFISLMFGLFQFGMPVIGYFVGQTFQEYVTAYIPWIGFALLTFLGIKSFVDWLKDFLEEKKAKKNGEEPVTEEKTISIGRIFIEAVATSIDALCIGFAYMALPLGEAMLFFGVIGVTTFLLSYLTCLLAKQLAKLLKRWAGLIAALVFIGIGLKILLEGLHVFG